MGEEPQGQKNNFSIGKAPRFKIFKYHRSYYKGHKDKIKGEGRGGGGSGIGWGGVEGWGENADNCN